MQPLSVDFYSAKNDLLDKPNEDFVFVDQDMQIYMVCDGITRSKLKDGSYPEPSPASKASRLFARVCHETLIKNYQDMIGTPKELLKKALANGNREVASFNAQNFQNFNFFENDRAGTAVLVCFIKDDTFYFASLGDCLCHIFSDSKLEQVNRSQTAEAEAALPLPRSSADLETIRSYRNNSGHKLGYGAVTGEASALDFIEIGSLQLKAGISIYLHSDGMDPFFNNFPEQGNEYSFEEINEFVCNWAKEHKERLDDRTVICLRF